MRKIEDSLKGYYACVDCGVICERINSSQKRCRECQDIYALVRNREKQRKRKQMLKELKNK